MVILADFGFLLWDQGFDNTLSKALDVLEREISQDAIFGVADTAFEAYSRHQSLDRLFHELLQIALENRLCE
jgi:hypothetical protein